MAAYVFRLRRDISLRLRVAGGQSGDRWGVEVGQDGSELVGGDRSVMQRGFVVSDSNGNCMSEVLSMSFSCAFELLETLVKRGLGGVDVERNVIGVEEGGYA